ncbi:MAG: nickel insertion protein, partial [Rubripirellula sp.]
DCVSRLFEAGALDVYQTACLMKKGRAGTQLSVLTPSPRVGLMERIIFEHSTAIGIRRYAVDRHKLPRENRTLETKFGPIRVKEVSLPNGRTRLKVEDDDARDAAKREGVSSEEIRLQIDLMQRSINKPS